MIVRSGHEADLILSPSTDCRSADRRGLFAAYRDEEEILFSLKGVGTRLSKPNPLHRVGEIWPELHPWCSECFSRVFPRVQDHVAEWVATAA